jgi:DNA-binding response OmpR family regulator
MTNRKQKLLIVEDDHALRQVLSDRLHEEGFEVITAENGEEGLNLALLHHPAVTLLDIFMPRMDGITMLGKLRRSEPWGADAYVLVITNSVDATTISTIAGFGKTEFLIKSEWGLEDIVARIKEILK